MSSTAVTKSDLMFFQNEILTDLKLSQQKITNILTETTNNLIDRVSSNEQKINVLGQKVIELTHQLVEESDNKQKINQFILFQDKAKDELISLNNRLEMIQKDLSNATYKYDNVITKNLQVPGLIGDSCQFPTLRKFLEHVHKNFNQMKSIQEKSKLDNNQYKSKIENLIEKFQYQINTVEIKFTDLLNKNLVNFENKLDEKINLVDSRINNLRMDNSKYVNDLLSKSDELKIQWNKMDNLKQEIYTKFGEEIVKFKVICDNNVKIFDSNIVEFKLIKQRFTELSEFIKDVRFGKNLKKSDFIKISKKIDFNKKQKLDEDFDDNIFEMNNLNDLNDNISIKNEEKNTIQSNQTNSNKNYKINNNNEKKNLKLNNIEYEKPVKINMNSVQSKIKNYIDSSKNSLEEKNDSKENKKEIKALSPIISRKNKKDIFEKKDDGIFADLNFKITSEIEKDNNNNNNNNNLNESFHSVSNFIHNKEIKNKILNNKNIIVPKINSNYKNVNNNKNNENNEKSEIINDNKTKFNKNKIDNNLKLNLNLNENNNSNINDNDNNNNKFYLNLNDNNFLTSIPIYNNNNNNQVFNEKIFDDKFKEIKIEIHKVENKFYKLENITNKKFNDLIEQLNSILKQIIILINENKYGQIKIRNFNLTNNNSNNINKNNFTQNKKIFNNTFFSQNFDDIKEKKYFETNPNQLKNKTQSNFFKHNKIYSFNSLNLNYVENDEYKLLPTSENKTELLNLIEPFLIKKFSN